MSFMAGPVGKTIQSLIGPALGFAGEAMQNSGPEMVPFQGGSGAQAIMDSLVPQIDHQLQRSRYLANQPKIAQGLPGVNAMSQQQQSIPGLDMNFGFSPAVTNQFAGPRLISPGIDESYFGSVGSPQTKQPGTEPWRLIEAMLMNRPGGMPTAQAQPMQRQIGPSPRQRETQQQQSEAANYRGGVR